MLFITAFIFSDLIDGAMARKTGRTSTFGAFFDSTLDRIGDGAIFGGLVLYFAGPGDNYLYLCLSLYCLVMGAVTSYARAKAESLGHGRRGRDRRAGRPHRGHPGGDRRLSDWSTCRSCSTSPSGRSRWPSPVPSSQRIWMVRQQALAEAPEG